MNDEMPERTQRILWRIRRAAWAFKGVMLLGGGTLFVVYFDGWAAKMGGVVLVCLGLAMMAGAFLIRRPLRK